MQPTHLQSPVTRGPTGTHRAQSVSGCPPHCQSLTLPSTRMSKRIPNTLKRCRWLVPFSTKYLANLGEEVRLRGDDG